MTGDRRSDVVSSEIENVPSAADGHATEILLVEANQGDIRLLRELFADAGITNEIHVVYTAHDALDFVHQRGEYTEAPRPDVILVDLHLFERRSENVVAAFTEVPELRHAPVIVMVSTESEADYVRSTDLDPAGYLTKPIDPDAFIDLIQEFDGFGIEIVCDPAGTRDYSPD